MNPRAVIGGNNPPDDDEEPLPPKAQRVIDRERAEQLLIAARLVSTLFRVPKNRIMEKRKGGEEGRAIRRFLILYARGLNSPVWECAKIFDLNRKQIGQEAESYLDMLARNPEMEEDAENLFSMCDYALRVDRARFLRVSLSEIQADAAARKAIKTTREAADVVELKPRRKLTEAERLTLLNEIARQLSTLDKQERIALRIIEVAQDKKAGKDQRTYAKAATAELAQIADKRAKLETEKAKLATPPYHQSC